MNINLSKEELTAIINALEVAEEIETKGYEELRENNRGKMNRSLTLWRDSINEIIALREGLEVIRRYHS